MKLAIEVVKIYYPKPGVESANKWYIIRTDKGIAKGTIGWRPEPKERLILDGEWTVYQGQREYKFRSATSDIPVDPRDMLHYACERTRGIGPSTEQKIWDEMRDDWQNVTADDVPALGRGKVLAEFQRVIEVLNLEQERTRTISWLMAHECTIKMAESAWDRWKAAMVPTIRENPYRLSDLPHYGFGDVDADIRITFDIVDNDPRRIRAGVIYAMKQLTETGNTAVLWESLWRHATSVLGGYSGLVADEIKKMLVEGDLVGYPKTERIALALDAENERTIYEYFV